MIAVIRSEWLKIRTTPFPWVLAGIAIVINALLILVYFLTTTGRRPGIGQQWRSTVSLRGTRLSPHHPTAPQPGRLGIRGYLLALLLGVLIVTTEFRHKTVTTSFLVTPGVPQFVGAS